MNKILILGFLCSFLVLSCEVDNSSKKKSTNSQSVTLKDSVIAVHDEVMPKMSILVNYNKQLNSIPEDSLSDTANKRRKEIIKSLKDADKAMWNWMYQYDTEKEDDIQYLKQQKISVNKMADKINNSLSDAKKFLDNYDE